MTLWLPFFLANIPVPEGEVTAWGDDPDRGPIRYITVHTRCGDHASVAVDAEQQTDGHIDKYVAIHIGKTPGVNLSLDGTLELAAMLAEASRNWGEP